MALRPDDEVALGETREEHVAKMDRPDAVVDFLEADVVLREGVGDEQQAILEAKRAGVADEADLIVPGILDRRQVLGEAA